MRRLTRRNLFAAVGAAPLAVAAVTQETVPPPASSREEDLKTARELMATNAAQLAKVKVPIATEPAFVFKA
jgi:hypothetical protein